MSTVRSLDFSSDGKLLATGPASLNAKGSASNFRAQSDIYLWDVATGKKIATLHGHEGQVNAVRFFSKGKRLASASADGTIRLWDMGSDKELTIQRVKSGPVRCLAISRDEKTLASGGDKTITLWDLK